MGSGAGLFAYFSRCEISIIYFPKQMYIKVAWVWLLCFRSGGLTNVPQTPTTMRGFKIKFALTRCIPCQCHATFILGHFFRKFPSRITSKIIGENSCQKGPRNIYTILKVQYLSKIQTKILEISFCIFLYFLPDKNIRGKVPDHLNYLNIEVSIRISYILCASKEQFGQKLDFWNSVI